MNVFSHLQLKWFFKKDIYKSHHILKKKKGQKLPYFDNEFWSRILHNFYFAGFTSGQIWLIPLVDVPKFTYFTKLEKNNPGPHLIKQTVFANSDNSKLNDHVWHRSNFVVRCQGPNKQKLKERAQNKRLNWVLIKQFSSVTI